MVNKKIYISERIFCRIIHDIAKIAEELRLKKELELAKKVNEIRQDFLSSLEED